MTFLVLLCLFCLMFAFLVIFKGKEAKARRRAREILDRGQIDDREEVNRLTTVLGNCDMDQEAQQLCKKLQELRSSATSMRFSPLQETVYVEAKARDMMAKADVFDAEKRELDRGEERRVQDSGYDLLSVAEEGRKKLESSGAPPEQYDEVLSTFEAALAMGISPFKQAIVHRRIGEIHHRCGRDASAIRHLEIAVRLNPKVGAKRLLDSLRKGYPSAPL